LQLPATHTDITPGHQPNRLAPASRLLYKLEKTCLELGFCLAIGMFCMPERLVEMSAT